MNGTQKGQRKMGRPLSENRAYAEEMGVHYRTILRPGGAKRLKAMPEHVRNVILFPLGIQVERKSLTARGMSGHPSLTRCFKPRVEEWAVDPMVLVRDRLRQRGLHG